MESILILTEDKGTKSFKPKGLMARGFSLRLKASKEALCEGQKSNLAAAV